MGLFEKVFGTHSEKELKKIAPIVDKIEALDSDMQALSDEELRAKTAEFKERLANGETLDDLLVEAFAVVREAAYRVLGIKHYRVQLIGGVVLHQGRIAEMRTGEGKTLVSTLPVYLNALEGKGVQVVTVNDYLAKRDAEWMGKVHEFLGLTVGIILNSSTNDERRDAYACDITYVTNNELGFDYLRDNMVIYKEKLVLRGLHYCVIDEVDSVLIDEARTPLIISGQSGKSTELYKMCDYLARRMKRGEGDGEISKMDMLMNTAIEEDGDFLVNEKDKYVMLTANGVKEVEQFFHIENLSDPENIEIQHNIILALRAHNLMFRDRDYVVKDDEVLIVDEFTGRIMPGRRFSDGLHQAIEAKENVKVKRESKTLATITFQNFFNMFEKKAGMTGTASTEEEEYNVAVPVSLSQAYVNLEAHLGREITEDDKSNIDHIYTMIAGTVGGGSYSGEYLRGDGSSIELDISAFTDPTTKNAADLVNYAIYAWESGWGYVWGTYGNMLTESLLTYKVSQYPDGVGNHENFIRGHWLGGRTADCVGLIKGYSWLSPETMTIDYGTHGMPDIGANQMYYNARESGPISTMPDIPGLAVWHEGHIGVYIGNGQVIEAMGTRYGVVKTELAGRGWTHWLKIPYINYD